MKSGPSYMEGGSHGNHEEGNRPTWIKKGFFKILLYEGEVLNHTVGHDRDSIYIQLVA